MGSISRNSSAVRGGPRGVVVGAGEGGCLGLSLGLGLGRSFGLCRRSRGRMLRGRLCEGGRRKPWSAWWGQLGRNQGDSKKVKRASVRNHELVGKFKNLYRF